MRVATAKAGTMKQEANRLIDFYRFLATVIELKVFMTSGTPEFMEKLREKHVQEKMYVLHGENTTLLLHETNAKTVFQTPRRYEVIVSSGSFEENGYFVFNNIPVSDEGRPIFEQRVKDSMNSIAAEPGFIAFRLLRPHNSYTYIVLTEWSSNRFYNLWKNSSTSNYTRLMAPAETSANSTLHLFSGAPSITTYISKEKENDA